MIDPQCTIVMPVRNRREVVKRTLKSLAEQLYRPLKVVIVDNGSDDGTLQVLQQWKERTQSGNFEITILEEPRQGATIARNTGLAVVDTDYVMFFDSDDVMAPWHVSGAMGYLTSHPEVDMLGWDVVHHYGERQVKKHFYAKDPLYHGILHGGLATQRYICRTQMMRDAGGWAEDVLYWNDIELGSRLLAKHPDAIVRKLRQKPTVHVYHLAESITGERFSDRADRAMHALRCMEANIGPENRYITDLKRIILAADCHREGEVELASNIKAAALSAAEGSWRKLILRCVYQYRRLGGRGAAHLVKAIIR